LLAENLKNRLPIIRGFAVVEAASIEALVAEPFDGGPYGFDLVEDALAIVLLASPPPEGSELDPEIARFLGRFAARAGVRRDASPEERTSAIEEYLAKLQVPERLLRAVERIFLGTSDRARAEAVTRFSRFAGEARTIEPKKPPKEHEVTGGQLARLQIDAKLEASLAKKRTAK
jgi:hypothetical protein